jgi:hypothetical protein
MTWRAAPTCPCLDSCCSQQVAPAGAHWDGRVAHKKSSTAMVRGQVGRWCSISGWQTLRVAMRQRAGSARYVTTGGGYGQVYRSTAMFSAQSVLGGQSTVRRPRVRAFCKTRIQRKRNAGRLECCSADVDVLCRGASPHIRSIHEMRQAISPSRHRRHGGHTQHSAPLRTSDSPQPSRLVLCLL